ncbi:MAG TPA: acyltransferase [Acidobacteriaceae bacterium]|nr:acyltransferase [Acidobacteriaceae bacterium]
MDQQKRPVSLSRGNTSDQKIHALTSARFFAALYVVIYHTRWGFNFQSLFGRIIELGYIAPYFFFLLSGYILAVVYLKKQARVPARRFFVSRFARIYPLFYLTMLMDLPFALIARVAKYGFTVAAIRTASLLGLSTIMLQMCLPTLTIINGASWSLSIEAAFYLSFPLIGPLLWKLTGRRALSASFLLYLGAIAIECLTIKLFGDARTNVSGYHLLQFEAVFACGILLARWESASEVSKSPAVISDSLAWVVVILSMIAFGVCVWLYEPLNFSRLNVAYLLVPVYMSVTWVLAKSKILPVRLLGHPWLVVLGEASYGLYLIHTPVRHLFERFHLTGSPAQYPLYLTTCIALSVLSFFYFETPSRRFILRKLHTQPKETREAASAAQ